jgi:hypothetical protein
MEISTAFVADAESFELVQPGEGPLYDPSDLAQPRSVWGAAAGDDRLDPALPQQATVLVVVVATVGIQPPGLATGTAATAADRRDLVQQRQELGDVMAVAAGERHRQGCAVGVDDQVVLGTRTASVDG